MTRIGFAKLYVRDLDGMVDFFVRAFGARDLGRIPLDGRDEALVTLNGVEPEIVLDRPHEPKESVAGTVYGAVGLIVGDCDKAIADCIAAGGTLTVAAETSEEHGVRFGLVASPEGHEFELLQHLETQAEQ